METIKAVTSKLKAAAWADLWIPTHMMHDAETDDQLAWLLLEHVHQHRGTKLQVRHARSAKPTATPYAKPTAARGMGS